MKVVTKAVGGVAAGQELWFPNTGTRTAAGATYTGVNAPGQSGNYWTSSNGYILQFYSGEKYGRSVVSSSKLYGIPIRCVR